MNAYTADHRSTLPAYRDWSPTGSDIRGLNAGDHADWLVAPCILTRDADHLEASNYAAVARSLAEVDPDGVDHETFDFNHWACGHFQILVVRPGSACHRVAVECELALADYPVLDDSDFSEREHEAQYESVSDELASMTLTRAGSELDADAKATLASDICQKANDSEPYDRGDVCKALAKLGWAEGEYPDEWSR